MQHTDKYKLNIIETSDPFSPDALNANARTLETQLARMDAAAAAETARVDAELAALDAAKAEQTALDALDASRLVYKIGGYTGTGKYGVNNKNRLEFDFKPLMVAVCSNSDYPGGFVWVNGQKYGRSWVSTSRADKVHLFWEDKALEWYSSNGTGAQLNTEDDNYYYFALGVAE